jgi:hypothetical protein
MSENNSLSEREAYEIAKDAYVYAYPLILTYLTAVQTTNYAEPTGIPTQAPVNQFSHARAFTPADFKAVVRPNVDTLYSPAVLDLGPEPIVLSVPATERYFMLPLFSLWTDVFAIPGTRTTGKNQARDFLLVGPNWDDDAPSNLEIIRSPTRHVDVIGRTLCNGPSDYENVHKIQSGYKLRPLSSWGKGEYVPPKNKVDPAIDMETPPPVQVEKMDAGTFFRKFSELLIDNPPQACDYPMIHRLQRLGFRVGRRFDVNAETPAIKAAFERAVLDGKTLVAKLGKKEAGEGGKGWIYTTNAGAYGVNYAYRAAVAYFALGENLPQDAIYPSLTVDSDGLPLDGRNEYVLHFEANKLPPVDAFWSVTAYDTDGYFIPNALNRFALGDRDKLVVAPDGSLNIFIQTEPPGTNREANWLPVAKGPFTLLMRLYSPKHEVIDGTWLPPDVKRQKIAQEQRVA